MNENKKRYCPFCGRVRRMAHKGQDHYRWTFSSLDKSRDAAERSLSLFESEFDLLGAEIVEYDRATHGLGITKELPDFDGLARKQGMSTSRY